MANNNRSNWVNPNPGAFSPNVNPRPVQTEEVDFKARISSELAALNQAVDGYQNDGGKTAQALVEAKLEVNRIMAELNAAKQRLEALEAQGSALDKFTAAVSRVEGGYQKLLYCSRSNIVGAVTGIINGGSRFANPVRTM